MLIVGKYFEKLVFCTIAFFSVSLELFQSKN